MKKVNLKNFGINVMAARKRKGISQEKLAELIGSCTNYVRMIETGRANITIKILVPLSKVLELDLNTLFKDM